MKKLIPNRKFIKERMRELGLTYREFGKRYRPVKSKFLIHYLINNTNDLKVLNKIANKLGMDTKDILREVKHNTKD